MGGVFRHARTGGGIDNEPGEGDLQGGRLVRAFGFDEGLTQSIAAFQVLSPVGQPDGTQAELGEGEGVGAGLAPFLEGWPVR